MSPINRKNPVAVTFFFLAFWGAVAAITAGCTSPSAPAPSAAPRAVLVDVSTGAAVDCDTDTDCEEKTGVAVENSL